MSAAAAAAHFALALDAGERRPAEGERVGA
jgi:hypothetical protein